MPHAVLPLLVKHHIAGKYGPQLSGKDCSSYHGLTKSAQCNSSRYTVLFLHVPHPQLGGGGRGGGGGGGGGGGDP